MLTLEDPQKRLAEFVAIRALAVTRKARAEERLRETREELARPWLRDVDNRREVSHHLRLPGLAMLLPQAIQNNKDDIDKCEGEIQKLANESRIALFEKIRTIRDQRVEETMKAVGAEVPEQVLLLPTISAIDTFVDRTCFFSFTDSIPEKLEKLAQMREWLKAQQISGGDSAPSGDEE
ncbi:MAG TPA: hypothetical protein VF773_15335 [Verrucomicrobiae bacterium]